MQTNKVDVYSAALIILELFGDEIFSSQDSYFQNNDKTYKQKKTIYQNNKERDIQLPYHRKMDLGDDYDEFCNVLKKLSTPVADSRMALTNGILALKIIQLKLEVRLIEKEKQKLRLQLNQHPTLFFHTDNETRTQAAPDPRTSLDNRNH
jgi:hypothetical protein